ncbi:disks large homolog 2-like [Stylophora pistillata]|uniref:disks large homolog 2-like n=1 Tax=Stylophora pistillata TaxID=50429 RepID=UPI000C03DFC6|nr:disks large homolog 2-like [Stylophora pistillata]
MAVRRGKFRAFFKSTKPADVSYDGKNSFENSQDIEIIVEVAVGPRGEISDTDVVIAGGSDQHHIPGNPGLFITDIRPGSEADKLLSLGCQIAKIDDVDVTNVPRQVADSLLEFADKWAQLHVRMPKGLDEVSEASSKMVSWGTVSFDTDNSDSGVGSGILEKEFRPNIDASEKLVTVKIAVGLWGQLLPLDFEI